MGLIDPWVYFGFFFDLIPHIRAFKGAYFTTRLTWTVPGAIVYHFFPPVVATYVLHLTLFYASTIALLPDSENDREPASRCPRSFAYVAPLLFLVERRLALHGWRGQYVHVVDALLRHFCVPVCAPKTMADRGRSVRGHGDYCQFFLIVFVPVVLGYAHFARRNAGIQWEAPGSFRLGLRHHHADLRRVQHGGEWAVPVLH